MEKLLLLNDSGNFGGVQSVFRNIIKFGKFNDYDVDILFATDGPIYDEVKNLGYHIDYVNKLKKLSVIGELLLLFKFMVKINNKLGNGQFEKVYASGFLSCVCCGILSFRYKKVKFIWHEHNMPRSNLRKLFLKFISKNIRKILVVSNGIKKKLFYAK